MDSEEAGGEVAIYGDNIIITDDERLVLRLHPEFALFPDLSITEVIEEIKCCLAKVRWQRASEDRDREQAQGERKGSSNQPG